MDLGRIAEAFSDLSRSIKLLKKTMGEDIDTDIDVDVEIFEHLLKMYQPDKM